MKGEPPLHLNDPQTFAEKCQWRKFYCPEIRQFAQLADKFEAQRFASKLIDSAHILPVLWVGDTLTEETIRQLGDRIVYQPTHRSGATFMIDSVDKVDIKKICSAVNLMLKWPYSMVGQEPWYGHINPRVIARPMITNSSGAPYLNDCKFHVFRQKNNTPRVICEIINTEPHWRAVFNERFERYSFDVNPGTYPPPAADPARPRCFENALNDALELSESFDYARIDFMLGNDDYYFTEFTFAPNGGYTPFKPSEAGLEVGSWWDLETGTSIKRFYWHAAAWIPLWKTEMPLRLFRRLRKRTSEWSMNVPDGAERYFVR